MRFKIFMLLIFLYTMISCSTEEEGVFEPQIEALDKAKELEKSIQDAADEQRKQLEQQTN